MENRDKLGNVPETSDVVLLIIDMISDFEFEDGDELFESALPAAVAIANFKKRARAAGIPAVFVNDNYGKWHSEFNAVIEYARESKKGREIVHLLGPGEEDYFVLKPKHSGFYSTALDILLDHLGAKRLILTGVTSDICILFTANDAYMRDYELFVPSDCVAAVKPEQNDYALGYIERVLKTNLTPSEKLSPELLFQ
jgi:nicotinamidase-related amidase